jgi:hypothetical protein
MLKFGGVLAGHSIFKFSAKRHNRIHFYCAFNARDIQMMADNWAQSEDIAMDNPLGGIQRGREEIRSVHERIFQGPAAVYVEYYDYVIHEPADMFYAVGRERGAFRLRSEMEAGALPRIHRRSRTSAPIPNGGKRQTRLTTASGAGRAPPASAPY